MDVWVITFQSVAQAFRAEKVLKKHGMEAKLIPMPRSISGSCDGLAVKIAESDVSKTIEILTVQGVTMLQKGLCVKAD